MLDKLKMVDSKDMVDMQKTLGYLKLLMDSSEWTRWTWHGDMEERVDNMDMVDIVNMEGSIYIW